MFAIALMIFGFLLMVILHELGHFLAAKKTGVKVKEFGIGIPPKVLTFAKDKSGTEYTLNLLPLGGFVRLKGEDPSEPGTFTDPDSFFAKSIRAKTVILLGGITANIILAWILLTAAFSIGVKPLAILPTNLVAVQTNSLLFPTYDQLAQMGIIEKKELPVVVQDVLSGSLAAQIGITSGDVILSVNGQELNTSNIGTVLKSYIGKEINLVYRHQEEQKQATITCPQDQCLLGIVMSSTAFDYPTFKYPLPQAAGIAATEIKEQTRLSFFLLGNLFKNLFSFDKQKISQASKNLHSPVMAVKMGQNIFERFGRGSLIAFWGIISLSLAIFNILPIPALDGGRLLSVRVQHLLKISPQKYFSAEAYANIIFFALLMMLGIFIIVKDVMLLQRLGG